MTTTRPSVALKFAVGFAAVFGVLTILSGGRVLFGGADMGAVVPFVLWFNFLAGFVYVTAGVGLWVGRHWAANLSLFLFLATALVFAIFGMYAWSGGAYEARTVAAMTLRCAIWGGIAWVSRSQAA